LMVTCIIDTSRMNDRKPISCADARHRKGSHVTTANSKKLMIKTKIWIEDEEGKVVFGAGRMRILNAVEEYGSILAASKELRMSYRAVWGKIKATEDRLGRPLLSRRTGGAQGGGSELTPLGKALVERFRELQASAKAKSDEIFQELFVNELPE